MHDKTGKYVSAAGADRLVQDGAPNDTAPIDMQTRVEPEHQPQSPVAGGLNRAPRIIRMKQLVERTSLSRSTLYTLIKNDPTFPVKRDLTPTGRSIGYLESEVDAWIAARADARLAA